MSSYTTEKLPKGVNEADLPDIIHVEGDIVEKVGDTPLKDGQLKNIVKQRKVIVSKFLDRGNEWHCFFQTYASLRGEENHNEGQPHFHYISDKWTRDRADVVAAIKSGNYLATSVHIDLLGYGGKE